MRLSSSHAQARLPARFARPARPEDPLAAAAAAWLCAHAGHPGDLPRRAARRRGLALSGAAPDGGSGLDPRRVGYERDRTTRTRVRADRGGEETARRRGVAMADGDV